jgi:hypothetical protein
MTRLAITVALKRLAGEEATMEKAKQNVFAPG